MFRGFGDETAFRREPLYGANAEVRNDMFPRPPGIEIGRQGILAGSSASRHITLSYHAVAESTDAGVSNVDDFFIEYFSGEDGSVLHFEAEFVVRCPRSDQTTRNGDALRFQLPDDPLVVEEVLLRLRGIPMR